MGGCSSPAGCLTKNPRSTDISRLFGRSCQLMSATWWADIHRNSRTMRENV